MNGQYVNQLKDKSTMPEQEKAPEEVN